MRVCDIARRAGSLVSSTQPTQEGATAAVRCAGAARGWPAYRAAHTPTTRGSRKIAADHPACLLRAAEPQLARSSALLGKTTRLLCNNTFVHTSSFKRQHLAACLTSHTGKHILSGPFPATCADYKASRAHN
eukprot:6210618-Pleurochrysis_carterae.AAC.7